MTPDNVLVDGLTLPEGMRWHDGKLWFSDLLASRVMTVDLTGKTEVLAEVPHHPSGLGFTPDGKLLVVSMRDSRLLRLEPDGLVEAANLSSLVLAYCNDMVVDQTGRAYVGDVGFDRHAGETPRKGALIRVDVDGRMCVAAHEVDFPNGAMISPDGRTLIVAETFGHILTAFDVDEAGALANRRVFARIDGTPDGIALDAEGGIWVADYLGHKVLRVLEGGKITRVIDTGERNVFSCALGGTDGCTLFYSTSIGKTHPDFQKNRLGRIETLRVEVPGA